MPIYRVNEKVLYYAHVPKCAGTSMNIYLERRFGAPAFQDRAYLRDPAPVPWNISSPQHIDAAALNRLFPPEFFDVSFTIVRHPARRIASIFLFQKFVQKTIPRWMPFGIWLKRLPKAMARNPYVYDNHVRPQRAFAPEGTRFFRLEDGFEPVIEFLDQTFGRSGAALEISHEKKARQKLVVPDKLMPLMHEIYAEDFEAFDYE